jgi:hypothetical protein
MNMHATIEELLFLCNRRGKYVSVTIEELFGIVGIIPVLKSVAKI